VIVSGRKLDDRSVIYRADDPAQKVEWRRFGSRLRPRDCARWTTNCRSRSPVGQPLGSLAVIGLAVVFRIIYILWRRRGNQRLTGSATTWPSP
jgi:hypothetical protein